MIVRKKRGRLLGEEKNALHKKIFHVASCVFKRLNFWKVCEKFVKICEKFFNLTLIKIVEAVIFIIF